MMDAEIEVYRKLGLPIRLCADYGLATECSAFGAEVRYDEKGFPGIKAGTLQSMDEAANLKIPDPYCAGLMPKVLETMEYMKANAPEDAYVEVTPVSAPFNTAAMLRGISAFCEDLAEEDPRIIDGYLSSVTELTVLYLQAQQKIVGNADRILIADDVSAFLSPAMFRRFVKPTYEALYAHFDGCSRWLHNDANAAHLAPIIAECGFDVWHIGNIIDMGKALSDTGGKLKLIGNLDPAILRTALPEEAAAAEKAQYDKFGEDPNFISGIGGFINYGTPVENVLAFIESTKIN